jgi:molybdenum cofactor biosynthesis protein B
MDEQQSHHEHGTHTSQDHPSYLTHKTQGERALDCMVVTCSDSRTPDTDTSGKLLCHLLKEKGHRIVDYRLIKDEPVDIRTLLLQVIEQNTVQVVIINGGTGISRRDTTFEAVDSFLEKRLEGFGELFRYLSYQEIGSAAMLSRATAGIHGRLVIFSIPGSQGAVRLAMERLILPELTHIAGELNK